MAKEKVAGMCWYGFRVLILWVGVRIIPNWRVGGRFTLQYVCVDFIFIYNITDLVNPCERAK